MDCIFCKIAKGDIKSTVIFENNDFKVILDVNPANIGHCLVVCKNHYENIIDMPEELVKEGFAIAKKIAAAVKKATDCDGVNILQNNGIAAGQTVFHFHIHIIPRFDGDSVDVKFGNLNKSIEEISAVADDIVKNM
ncbi:MAG: HIT family protein [Clostridia bacterium]|nr:HIT family protein [Clostridia bacterium]